MSKPPKHGKEITLEEIKVLQMDVLEALDEFCDANNIRYSMACGTLLGAIRHKGYIPWDDDIDIYVPREDYKRLMAEFPDRYRDRYKIASLERDMLWEKPYAKAYDDRTLLYENSVSKKDIGVNIDIFPIDDVPDSDEEWRKYDNERRRQQGLFILKTVRLNRNRPFRKNIILALFHIGTCLYPTRKWAKKLDILAQKNNGKGYSRCFECCQGIFQKQPFPKKIFNNIINIPFEDRLFKSFSNADLYLRNGFGNYMQLPPEENRITHHDFRAYWRLEE